MSRFKLVVIVRSDLNLSRGQVAAQVAHCSMKAILSASQRLNNHVEDWKDEGGTVVVLRTPNRVSLGKLGLAAEDALLPLVFFHDDYRIGGKEAYPMTCIAIGPDFSEAIDVVTGKLHLL